ncbi:MAG: hypothetical protein HQK89_07090 [Nitrospirae bacterium]|nr:hypothetical protein [Nitrospirota bacterium]
MALRPRKRPDYHFCHNPTPITLPAIAPGHIAAGRVPVKDSAHAVGRVVGEKADAVRDKLHDIIKLQVLDLKEEFDKWQASIDAVANDFGLSREQRASGISALHKMKRAAANAARLKILEE